MRRPSIRPLLTALAVGLCAASAQAAGPAAALLELEAGPLPEFHGTEASWRARLDIELLTQASDRLTLAMPDGLEFVATKIGFERRGPASLTWRGRLADSRESRAILSMEEGVVSGWIHTPYGQYEIRPLAGGSSAVLRMSAETPGACGADEHPMAELPPRSKAPLTSPAAPQTATDSPSSIDVLALFTSEARDALGGAPQAKSRVRLMIDLANEAFGNSGMKARLNLAHVAIAPLNERASMSETLSALRQHAGVGNLRETHKADLVALVQSQDESFCGIAYIMDENSKNFLPYAYSVTAYSCLTTLAHEVGHNMGMEHDPANANPVATALFPWAFAHFSMNNWRTVMSYPDACGECIGIPYFSNPGILYEGLPLGLPGERDNARVGDQTAGTIANFHQSGVVLTDDFESGTLSNWQLNRGGMALLQPGLEGDYLLNVPMTGLPGRRFLMHKISAPGNGVDVQFLFNANNVELEGAEVDLLVLFGNGKAHTKLTLKEVGETLRLVLVTRGSTGGFVEVGSTPVRLATNETIRVEWRGATDDEVADGFVRLAKNGGSRGALRDFANDRWSVREVRLGIPFGAAGTSGRGRVYVDNYKASVPIEPQ